MKFLIKNLIVLSIITIFLSPIAIFAIGEQSSTNEIKVYTLTQLPGVTEPGCTPGKDCQTTFGKYIPAMFRLLIGVAAALAVVRIVLGGFKYMSTDAISGKSEGKEQIWMAIQGLILVLFSWLILNTINPQLLKFDLSIDGLGSTKEVNTTIIDTGKTIEEPKKETGVKEDIRVCKTITVLDKDGKQTGTREECTIEKS